MKKLKIGMIGCGGIANGKHCPSLAAFGDLCEMVAFCDLIEARAVKTAAEFGAPDARVYLDYRQLLVDKAIDAVHVCTPNATHAAISADALAAGKHVMCEKPMAHTSADAAKMLAAWKSSGKKLTIGYQNRFRPEVQMLKKLIEAGELGEIYYGKAIAIRRRAVPNWGVFLDKAQQGGGPLIDIGTHSLDMTLWMMDNYQPARVSGSVFYKLGNLPQATEGNIWGPWDVAAYDVEDSAMGFIKMKNGAAINIETSWALNLLDSREASTTLCGTKAGAEILSGMSYPDDQLIINRGKAGMLVEERLSGKGAVAYYEGVKMTPGVAEAKHWLQAIIDDTEPVVKPEQAFVVTQILEAIYRSSEQGQEMVLG